MNLQHFFKLLQLLYCDVSVSCGFPRLLRLILCSGKVSHVVYIKMTTAEVKPSAVFHAWPTSGNYEMLRKKHLGYRVCFMHADMTDGVTE